MPKFDASAFSDVEYDFTGFRSTKDTEAWKRGDSISDRGVVPEPSRHMVAETMKAVSAAFKSMQIKGSEDLGDEPTPDQVSELMEKMDADDEHSFETMADKLVDIIADLCQGSPKKDSLDALSWPKFMGFFGYIMEHLLSPEASVPGTNSTPKRLKSV